jgi:catechol 2,3-dioxygenase-like lactoylglutathione lyase family enzyme
METTKAIFKNAWPYQEDKMNLPVKDLEAAIPFYQNIFRFSILSRSDHPYQSVVLGRDEIQIGLAENGGDPTQDGCFFEVDNVLTALKELNANGFGKEESAIDFHKHEDTSWKLFYMLAPDGLCYCVGEKPDV